MTKRSDISRDSFRPDQGYTSVRLQQGRPQLDSDWNEQMDLQYQRERSTLLDTMGQAAAVPSNRDNPTGSPRGFQLSADFVSGNPTRIVIHGGRVYLGGRLIEAEGDFDFTAQPFCPGRQLPNFGRPTSDASLWVAYLESFEQEVTAVDDSALREVALGGPDTTTRTQTVWQVGLREISASSPFKNSLQSTLSPLAIQQARRPAPVLLQQPGLEALFPDRFTPDSDGTPRHPAPSGQLIARFTDQGATLENRLYRVEVVAAQDDRVELRWSRDNGAVLSRLIRVEGDPQGGQVLILSRPAVGDASLFSKGQWLEITTSGRELRGEPSLHQRIRSQGLLDAGELRVPIEGTIDRNAFPKGDGVQKVRLWNDRSGGTEYPLRASLQLTPDGVRQSAAIPLEDGVEVTLVLPIGQEGLVAPRFAPGQYWQIPMRAQLGGIDWPADTPRRALAAEHNYLVLGVLIAIPPTQESRTPTPIWTYLSLTAPANVATVLAQLNEQATSQQQALNNLRAEWEATRPRSYEVHQTFTPPRFLAGTERFEVTYQYTGSILPGYKATLVPTLVFCDGLLGSAINPLGNTIVSVAFSQTVGANGEIVITAVMPINCGILRVNVSAYLIFSRNSASSDLTGSIKRIASPSDRL